MTQRLLLVVLLSCGACTARIHDGRGSAPDDVAPGGDRAAGGRGGASGPPAAKSSFVCRSTSPVLTKPRLWRLTGEQLNDTIADLLGDSARSVTGELFKAPGQDGFLNAASTLHVRDTEAAQLRVLAKRLGGETVADARRLAAIFETSNCTVAKLADAGCGRQFVAEFGKRAFRRPLESAEVDAYLALYQLGNARGPTIGVQVVIEAMLQSPKFLYRFELGTGTGRARLTPHELASALSYTVTGSMPDAELMRAADRNELTTTAQLEAQARRLLATEKGRTAATEFYRQLLEYEELGAREKDATLFPEYAASRADLAEELRLLVADVMFGADSDGTLRTLLTASHTFANARIGKLYGETVTGSGWQRIATNPEQRAGILTLPGLMSHLAALERTSPVNRGRFVQERFFCAHIPDPPPDADTSVPELKPGSTRRQQLEQKTAPPTCSACHALMNGIGFGLENLDAIGRFRATENGLPIDASGEVKGTADSDGAFVGPRALAERLADSQQVKECLTRQAFRYAVGRLEGEGDGCSLATVHDRFTASGDDLRELIVSFVLTETFTHRQR